MRALAAASESRPRLNPFAFPSDTTSRFFLLLVFVAAADIAYWHGIALQLGGTITEFGDCLQGWPASISDVQQAERLAHAIACMQLLAKSELPWLGLGLVLLGLVTFALYRLHPVWIRKRLGLTTFPEKNRADIAAVLRELCGAAGLPRYPVFLWNPLNVTLPIVFGRNRCHFVALTGGFVKRFYSERGSFCAVVLHELAHIRNGDISKGYLTIAVWWSFVTTALAPYLVVEFGLDHDLKNVLDVMAGILFFGGIVWLSLTAVLRARECYADVRASSWDQKAGLAAAIEALIPERRWLKWLAVHPAPPFRRLLLKNTDPLFHSGWWDLLGIGAAATFAFFILAFLLAVVESVFGGPSTEVSWLLVPALATVPLIAASAGIMVWRSTFLDCMRGGPRRGVVRAALALAAGMTLPGLFFVGYPLVVAGAGGPGREFVAGGSFPISLLLVSAGFVLITALLLLTAIFVLYLSWVEAGARAWLPVALRLRAPPAVWIAGVAVAAVLAIPWFAILPLMIVGGVYEIATATPSFGAAGEAFLFGLTRTFPTDVILWVSIIGVWAYPMAAALWQPGPNPVAPAWAFLDRPASVNVISPLRPCRALLLGLVGGMAGGLALWWTLIDIPAELSRGTHYLDTKLGGLIALALIVQVATGIAAALAIRRLAFVHAMFAAFVAGSVLLVPEYLRLVSWGLNADIGSTLGLFLAPTLVGGAVATLVPAAAVSFLVDRRP